MFLVASHGLDDPNFSKTVVLLVHAGSDGAAGYIVNRRTTTRLENLLPGLPELEDRSDYLWIGGPVERHAFSLLARTPTPPEGATPVIEDVYLLKGEETVRELFRNQSEPSLRLLSGYAGWAPGQLEAELAVGGWHLREASAAWIFEEDPDELWYELVKLALSPVA